MKKFSPALLLWTLALLLINLPGCGTDSFSPNPAAAIRLSGVVEDGPIENANISLRDNNEKLLALCGSQGNSRCETVTDAAGAYSLQVQAGTDLTTLSVIAGGGRDRATGIDFTGLEMRSPLALFSSDVTTIVTSPLTTLVAKLQDQGLSLGDAQNRVRSWLALPPATNLAARPTLNLDLQRRAVLLSKIVLEINAGASAANPFVAISEKVTAATPLLVNPATCNPAVLTAFGLNADAQLRVAALQTNLATATTIGDVTAIFKQNAMMEIFAANFKQLLNDAAAFDALQLDPQYQENLNTLAKTTLIATGSEVIPLGGTIPQRIARYILFTYQLLTPGALTRNATDFATLLQPSAATPLENDPWIAELARSDSLYSVVSPLLLSELPGNDNQQRLAYFYDSDLSPHYLAEKLIGQVYDDAINDAILLKIVEGKANAGLIDEARTMIATQIVQSEAKANAYRALANALILFGRMAEARAELLRARDLYYKVIDAKGKASANDTDTKNLQETAASFRKAGYVDDALVVLQYLAEVAQALVSNPSAYGRLLVGTWNVADLYIAAGDLPTATPIVDSLYDYAQMVPASLTGSVMTYKSRVFYLVETCKRYAQLGQREPILQIFTQIQALCAADGYRNLTGAESWANIPSLVESLYRVGYTGEALALADSIPTSYINALGNIASGVAFQVKAFKLVATDKALSDNLDAAFEIVEARFTKPEDKVDALTYFASNKSAEYIGLALIRTGRLDQAQSALAKAELYLAGMTESTDPDRYTYLIQRGYVKVADLYAMAGNPVKAQELLQQAQGIVSGFVGIKEIVNGLVDIALCYQQIGQPGIASELLQNAASKLDTIAGSLSKPEDAALLYESLIKAYLLISDKNHAYQEIVPFLRWSRDIHLSGSAYTGTANDDLAAKEVDCLLRAAKYLVSADFPVDAVSIIDEAKITADLILVEANRLAKYIFPDPLNPSNLSKNHLIGAYANAGEYNQALNLALGMKFTTNRNQAIAYLSDFSIRRDDFPGSTVASIDTDDDGQPDFFHPLVSAEEIAASGLILDNDSDGDGIVDTVDFRPLFAD